jgi:Flp pilus assembly protein TadG
MNINRRTIASSHRRGALSLAVRGILKDERGQTLPIVALLMTSLLGMSGLVVDVGHAYVVRGTLQNAANASALAAAGYVYTSSSQSVNATTVANQYSAASGGSNLYSGGNVNTTVSTRCVNMLMPLGSSCTSSSPANSVVVKNTTSINTLFMRLFGVRTLNVSATATASMQGASLPWNIAIIVDSTGSMASTDSNCNNLTQFQCALNGVQTLMENVNPCPSGVPNCTVSTANVRMALFTFPNVLTAVNGNLPVFNGTTYDSIKDDVACGGSPATFRTPTKQPIAAPYTLPVPGASLPVYTSGTAPSAYAAGLNYLTYSNTNGATTTTWDASYQITPFLSDYYSASSSTKLNPSSYLVQAAGNGSTNGCLTYTFGVDGATGGGSNFGNTYLASSIYAAQSALNAQQLAYGGRNAIIFLSDGDANASYYAHNSGAYGTANSTNQFVDATEFPEAPANSEVGPTSSSYKVPAYYTPATIVSTQSGLGYDTLSSTSPPAKGSGQTQARSGSNKGIYPDWFDQCQQAITAGQYATNQSTTVIAVAYGASTSGCNSGWNVGLTDTTGTATGSNVPFSAPSGVNPCVAMENIATTMGSFYSDYNQGGSSTNCQDTSHPTVTLEEIFEAVSTTFTTPRLIPNNAT